MAFSGPIADRLEIRELVETYNDAVNRRQTEDWKSTWADNAIWDLLGMEIEGREAIVKTWKSAIKNFSYMGFSSFPGAIEINGETAHARIYVRETLISQNGQIRNIEGMYNDELVKQNGQWRFRKRAYQILHETSSQKGQ